MPLVNDFDYIIVNQLIGTFAQQPGYVINNGTGEVWSWKEPLTTNRGQKLFLFFFKKVGQLIGFPIAFCMISVINGLVIRFVLICSNVCVVPLLWALNRAGIRGFERNRATIYHSMGVLGAEMANYDRNSKSKVLFCVSLFTMLNVAYFIQTCTFYIWMRLVFPSTFPAVVSDMYFAYLNLMELVWLIFGRTRLTLKYYPKITTLYNLLFLVYFNSYSYAASAQLLMTIICLDITTVLWFLKNCELPGMKLWNPFDLNTPSP